MEESLKIKLSIADRVYPLTITKSQEQGLRQAAKEIEMLIRKIEESYAVRDKQDVLAMSALQFAYTVEQNKLDKIKDKESALLALKKLNYKLEEHLNI